jgi:hypothetical protein
MAKLTTLAPDIVVAILDDERPNQITLFDLAVDSLALWVELKICQVDAPSAFLGGTGPGRDTAAPRADPTGPDRLKPYQIRLTMHAKRC